MPDPHARPATLLCVSITAAAPPLAEQARRAIADGADLVELRVDCIEDVPAIADFLRRPDRPPAVLTVRSVAQGGRFDGTDAERIALLEQLGLLLPGYVDVELELWRRSANLRQKVRLVCDTEPESVASAGDQFTTRAHQGRPASIPAAAALRTQRPRNRLVLSHHDWRGTPVDLEAVLQAVCATPGSIGKAAFTAQDATDGLRVLAALAAQAPSPAGGLIAISMGTAGIASRILARKFGAFLSFAAAPAGEQAAAPGQLTAVQMQRLYRWREIDSATRVYGVVGWPVAHSRSPHVHNAAMRAAAVNGVYVPLPVRPQYERFCEFMNHVQVHPELDISGLSVTIPHKEHARRWLHDTGGSITAAADRAGAVNTLTRTADGWQGENTDGRGALAALLQRAGLATVRDLPIAILGAGGAARGLISTLVAAGGRVTIFNRTSERARELAAAFNCAARPWSERGEHGARLLVNCTALGMTPREDESPLPAAAHRGDVIVFDTVYSPPQTRLLREAATAGCLTISGVDMFLAQAAEQFSIWHGLPPPTGVMQAGFAADLV